MLSLWVAWAGVIAVTVISSISWRLFLYFRDPKGLRRFSNMSLFSGLSNLPFMIVAHGGARSEYMLEKHQTTGKSVLRIGPKHLSYSDPEAIKYIYGHGTKCSKDAGYDIQKGTHWHLADVVDKPDHARKRKILASAYALKNLEEWEYKVADKVERLVRQFDKRCTAPLPKGQIMPNKEDLNVNYRMWTNFFTIEAIADIGISEKLGFLDRGNDLCDAVNPDGTTFTASFRDALYTNNQKTSLIFHSYDWYKTLDKLSAYTFGIYRKGTKAAKAWDGIHLRRTQKRIEAYRRGEKHDDFAQALLEEKSGKPNNLELGEIDAEINIMLNAGSTTTAIAVGNAMYNLLKHPHILAKLREEIDQALDPEEVVAPYDSVKNLPYLRAVLDESLRYRAPTPQNLGRVTPPEGLQICDQYIPGGVSVSVSAHVMHNNEAIFPEPQKFIPERFLGEEGKKLQPYFLAFSAGARGCIGRNISYLEQTLLIASLVHRYEFALPSPDWEVSRLETMNWHLGEMWMKVWRRDIPGAECLTEKA